MKERISLSIEYEVVKLLLDEAKKENRTASNMAEVIFYKYFKKMEKINES